MSDIPITNLLKAKSDCTFNKLFPLKNPTHNFTIYKK